MNTEHFKQKLLAEQAEVEKELSAVGRINPENPNDWEAVQTEDTTDPADPNDVADKIENYEGNTAILKQLEIRFNEIKGALARIEAGTYGTCEICGAKIEDERLEANPAARTCKQHVNQ